MKLRCDVTLTATSMLLSKQSTRSTTVQLATRKTRRPAKFPVPRLCQITTHLITSLSSSTILHCHCRTMASAGDRQLPHRWLDVLYPAGSCILTVLANRLIILSRVGQQPTPNTKTRPGGLSCPHKGDENENGLSWG